MEPSSKNLTLDSLQFCDAQHPPLRSAANHVIDATASLVTSIPPSSHLSPFMSSSSASPHTQRRISPEMLGIAAVAVAAASVAVPDVMNAGGVPYKISNPPGTQDTHSNNIAPCPCSSPIPTLQPPRHSHHQHQLARAIDTFIRTHQAAVHRTSLSCTALLIAMCKLVLQSDMLVWDGVFFHRINCQLEGHSWNVFDQLHGERWWARRLF